MNRFPRYWLAANIKPNWMEIPTNDPAELHQLPIVAIEIKPARKARNGALRKRQTLGVPAGAEQLFAAFSARTAVDRCACALAESLGVNGSRAEA